MDYGMRLRELRAKKGLSQKELTDRLNINRSTYARYETSATQPDYETLRKIAEFYDVSIDYIIGSSVDSKHTIRGEEVDTSDLSENQRLVLDWAMQQEALSFHSADELRTILDNLALIMEYEKAKNEHNRNNKH